MPTAKTNFETIDEYIKTFPKDTQAVLEKLRETIRKTVPTAAETISYQIPTFKLNGKYVVYFAGYTNHVSVYPLPSDKEIAKELARFRSGKGTVRFPLDEPIPYALVKKMVKALLKERHGTK